MNLPKKVKKRITSRSGKNKGKRLQKLVADMLSEITGVPNGKDEMIESRESGQAGVDVKIIGYMKKIIPLAIECKNQEKWNVHAWVDQAIFNQDIDNDWVLVCKRNRKSPVVIISFEFFTKLMKLFVKKNIRKMNKEKS